MTPGNKGKKRPASKKSDSPRPADKRKTHRPKSASKPASKSASKPPAPADPMHDGSRTPDDALLRKMLGKTMGLWIDLRGRMAAADPPALEEWKFYGSKYGWGLKMMRGKRNLFFFGPRDGAFTVTFVFGDRAVEAVQRSGIPDSLKRELLESKKYVEGRGLPVAVKSRADVETVLELVGIKIRN
jgi:hypothetical protein